MPSILDYYKYAKLATAAYVQLEEEPGLGVDRIAFQANRQERLPLKLAEQMFLNPQDNPEAWTIPAGGYFGNDLTSGFAATLFVQGTEKVLAIRGTEPTAQGGVDLFQADLAGIGVFGFSEE